jgi:Rrf2 family protein
VRVTAKVDYAVRALVLLAVADREDPGRPVKRDTIAEREGIPPAFLEDILRSLRNGQLVRSQRGAEGGWRLARPATEITVADIIRVVEGPLANVRGVRPHELGDHGTDETQVRLWVAVRASLRAVLEKATVAALADGTLPRAVERLAADPDAWDSR